MTTDPWTGKPEAPDAHLLTRAKAMSEADLQSCVETAARYRGWLAYHTHDSRRSQAGFPDLVLIQGDRILWRELKTMTGRIRPEQHQWLNALTTAGSDVAIWRPIDWLNGTIDRELATTGTRP